MYSVLRTPYRLTPLFQQKKAQATPDPASAFSASKVPLKSQSGFCRRPKTVLHNFNFILYSHPNPMTTSTPFNTPANTLASQHGNLSSRTSSRSMAFNPHESHPLEREQEQDAMDTSLDFTPDNSERTEKQADQPCDTEALGLKNAESVLEQPREGQSHSVPLVQKGKTSSRPLVPSRSQILVDTEASG